MRVQIEKPDVIVIMEVNNKNTSNPPELTFYNIENYQMHTNSLEKGHRGIIVYTINSLKNVTEINVNSTFSENIILSIDVGRHEKLLLCAVYRSERGSEENNTHLLDLLREINTLKYHHKLIVGDFNYPHISLPLNPYH